MITINEFIAKVEHFKDLDVPLIIELEGHELDLKSLDYNPTALRIKVESNDFLTMAKHEEIIEEKEEELAELEEEKEELEHKLDKIRSSL